VPADLETWSTVGGQMQNTIKHCAPIPFLICSLDGQENLSAGGPQYGRSSSHADWEAVFQAN
jgi:hypothetical protein